MNSSPEIRPVKWDALVVLAVLLTALLCAGALRAPETADDALWAVVSIDGAETDRFALSEGERIYEHNGVTLRLRVTAEGLRVEEADCPSQDCVRTGEISRAGQSIVCLPARIVITLESAGAAPFDVIAG